MTKVDLHYKLVRPIDDGDVDRIAKVHSHFGIFRVRFAPSQTEIEVEYDASRLSDRDVEAALLNYGFPIQRRG
jgi:hypothetical protein